MITKEDVLEVLHSLPADKHNPDVEDGCVYTSPKGNHCVAGECFVILGTYLPGFGDKNNGESIDHLFDDGLMPQYNERAAALLSDVQTLADTDCTWGEAIEITTTYSFGFWRDLMYWVDGTKSH